MEFQADEKIEKAYIDIETSMSTLSNESYCKTYEDSTKTFNPNYKWIMGKIVIKKTTGADFTIGTLINPDNFYWDDGNLINMLYYEFSVKSPKEIKNINDANSPDEKDLSKIEMKSGDTITVNYKILTDNMREGYPVLKIVYDNGYKMKFVHLRKDVSISYTNKEYLKPKVEKNVLTLSKEECVEEINKIKKSMSERKVELNMAFDERNENKATDIQNKIKALELELKKYEDYLKTLE